MGNVRCNLDGKVKAMIVIIIIYLICILAGAIIAGGIGALIGFILASLVCAKLNS